MIIKNRLVAYRSHHLTWGMGQRRGATDITCLQPIDIGAALGSLRNSYNAGKELY